MSRYVAFGSGAVAAGVLLGFSSLAGAQAKAGLALEAESPPLPAAEPEGFSDTELHAMAMFGPFRLDQEDVETIILTFQHFSTFKYGSNFFFLDVTSQPRFHFLDERFGLYFEYAPSLSITQLLGAEMDGVLANVSISPQLNLGYAPGGFEINRVFLLGPTFNWNVPGFLAFETQFLARMERTYDPSWQFTFVWNVPFSLGGAPGEFRGFFDLWQSRENPEEPGTEDKIVVLTQPQLMVKVGRVYVGTEIDIRHDFPRADFYPGSSWDYRIGPMVVLNF